MSSRRQRVVKRVNKSSQSVKSPTETTELDPASHSINTPQTCNKTTTHTRPARCRTIQSANFDSPRIVGRPKQTKSDDHLIGDETSESQGTGGKAESVITGSKAHKGRRRERQTGTARSSKTKAVVVSNSHSLQLTNNNILTDQQDNEGSTADKLGLVSDKGLTVPCGDKSSLVMSAAASVECSSVECDVEPVAAADKQIVLSEGVHTNVNVAATAADTPRRSMQTATRRRVAAGRNRPNTESHKITEFFAVRRSSRTQTAKELKEQKELDFQKYVRDNKHDGLEVVDIDGKGRGVVTTRPFLKGDFVVEYAGDLINLDAAKNRENKYSFDCRVGCYMYYFQHHDKNYCIDATSETGLLGRLINHSQKKFNCVTKVIDVDGRPRLILVSSRDVETGEELLYDYGDRNKESLDAFPWLAL